MSLDRAFGAVIADADPHLNGHEQRVLRVLADWPAGRALTLDSLADLTYPHHSGGRPYVFHAVARLEDISYLTRGEIR